MKNLFFEALTKAKQERRKSSARSAHPLLKITSMVILLLMVSVNVWGTHPGGDYTLITSASSLSEGDAVILYDDVNNVGVTGSTGTSAAYSSTSTDWIEYTVHKVNGTTITLADWSLLTAPKIYAEEDGNKYKFTYSTDESSNFTINSNGYLVIGSTRLAHYGDYIRFYGSSGTALKVYKVGHPKTYEETCDDNLCINPNVINMAGEYDGVSDAEINSSLFVVTTQYRNRSHYVYVECEETNLSFGIYYYDDDAAFGSNGHFTPTTSPDNSRLKIKCWASAIGTFSATLHVYAYDAGGSGVHKHVSIPVTITVLEEEQDCTPSAPSFENDDVTIYWPDVVGQNYTQTATRTGTGAITYSITDSDPADCATINASTGQVHFTNLGTIEVTASVAATATHCAGTASYILTMACKERTLSFTTTEPTVSITSGNGTYSQAPSSITPGSGYGTITYTIDSDDGLTIDDPSTGVVSFNGNAGTAMVTATISPADGYCSANNFYFLTVTPVVPTVSAFTPSTTETSIKMTGSEVTNKGGSAITRYGYIYSTTLSTPETLIYGASGAIDANVGTNDIALNTGFDKTVTELSAGNTYYVRAYATNTAGTGYSDIQTIKTVTYEDYVFTCAELTLTPKLVTAGTPIFITSSANKTVRSQDSILIVGSGLTPNQALEFPGLNSKFTIKSRANTALSVEEDGTINAVAYIFYTPGEDETTDGLLKITGLTVSVGGTKPKTATLTQNIIGRHLPANFVIAGKKDNKWYALPSNMESTSHPAPVEIAVDNLNNPSIAYTVASNKYGMVGPTNSNISGGNGQYIRFTMSINDGNNPAGPAPLFGTNVNDIGKSGPAKATSDLSAGWWWKLQQENTSITNPQDAKYKIYCANNTSTLSIKDNAGNAEWGLYASGVEELRLIPASDIIYTEAYFVEWGQHGGVVEVDATGIDATSVVAHLGEATSSAITLSQTGTSVKGSATKYNYTVNFGEGIDFAAATSNGALLRLEWKKGEAVKAMTSLVVPKIIASNATMSSLMPTDEVWRTEVHVLPGFTLTADAGSFKNGDVTIKQLEIYPGAIVKVTTGTLDISTLVLRNGWTRVGTKDYNVAQLQIKRGDGGANVTKSNIVDNWYTDWYIDYDQYYPIAVPWNVTVANIKYKNSNSAASAGLKLRYYDGEQRASSGQSQVGQNWKEYSPLPTTLSPSKAYAMTAKRPSGKAFSIIRMPLTFPGAAWTALGEQGEVESTHKNEVTVTGWGYGTSTPWYAMGWNFIGNPYMSIFNGDDDGISGKLEIQNGGSIRYATIPDLEFQNYYQVPIAEARINPASGFFIQANKAGEQTVTFAASKIDAPAAAPARFLTQDVTLPEQEAYILLSYEGGKDQMGLIIGDDYTADYEVNADLAKVLGEGNFLKTYMNYGGMDMAYVAINSTLAKEWIPVTVKIPATGEYTFSLTNSSSVEELEGVFLIDYANGSVITNLIGNDYVFTAEEGTITDRFAINATYGGRETPTLIDAVQSGAIDSDKPIKFLFHEKVYILYQGIIYDAVGKKVSEINK